MLKTAIGQLCKHISNYTKLKFCIIEGIEIWVFIEIYPIFLFLCLHNYILTYIRLNKYDSILDSMYYDLYKHFLILLSSYVR